MVPKQIDMAVFQLYREQNIPAPLDVVWNFMTSPLNLKKITPANMNFTVTSPNLPDKIYEGLMIRYKVSPLLNIPLTWVTEITHVKPQHYFVDEQRKGPYAIWHHEHWFEPTDNGVLMKDFVTYSPPLGFLGNMANTLFIRKKLHDIFMFRKESLEREFGSLNN